MSYILDALQKAEAERERGRVPGLKSQLVPPTGHTRTSVTTVKPRYVLAGVVVLLVSLASLAAWWSMGTPAATAPQADTVSAASPSPVQALPDPVPTPAPSVDRLIAPPEPVLPILAPPRPTPAEPKAVPAASAPPIPAPATAATPNAATAAAPASPAAAPAVPSFGQLSAEARAQLPAVNVSGSTYSQNPALRMLIANGKVVQEGQDIAPGLKLETIGPRSAVLNHQGMRYSIGY